MNATAPPWTEKAARAVRNALARGAEHYDHQPGAPVDPARMYAPVAHGIAVALDRPLVVGGRGTGKSYLANVLCADETRRQLADAYRYPRLRNANCFLGFVDRLGATNAPFAPTADEIRDLLEKSVAPDRIWRAVLCRFLADSADTSLFDIYQWWCRALSERSPVDGKTGIPPVESARPHRTVCPSIRLPWPVVGRNPTNVRCSKR